MKIFSRASLEFLSLLGTSSLAWGGSSVIQPVIPAPTPYALVAKDANSSVWQRTVYELDPSGNPVPKIHSYTEVATGLHYQQNGQWLDSQEQINILPNGTAAATNGQHQAYFPGDIYQGQIELVTPDGKQLYSQPLCLCYFDGTNSVVIAVLTNSIGQVFGANQVIYPNAFTGLSADIRFTYTKAGFEQDIILRQQPPTPESLGLSAASARIEMLTEFFNPPQPAIQSTLLPPQAGLVLADDSLGFGKMQMIQGRAFLMGSNSREAGALVDKEWLQMNGRQILVEEVPVDAIVQGLAALPLAAMHSGSAKNIRLASRHLVLPKARLANTNSPKAIHMAKAEMTTPGFVLDYQTINSSQTNFTFRGDTTYYISGVVNLYQTNTYEGGTVLKYATNASVNMASGSRINWQTAEYRPAVFTAMDDNSIGETISGSSGNPTGYYANPALSYFGNTDTTTCFRIVYAKQGISGIYNAMSLYHGQFINCLNGIAWQNGGFSLRNVLFANDQTNITCNSASSDVQNATFSGSTCLVSSSSGGGSYLTNCILVNVTYLTNSSFASISGDHNGFYNSPAFGTIQVTNTYYPFVSVGGGNFYLSNVCNFLNAGTASINAALLVGLANRTTHPPIAYTNVTFAIPTNFAPQAVRDTNSSPDLGYHYDPLDYSFGHCQVTSNITFSAGTAVGWFRTSSGYDHAGDGIHLMDYAVATFNGTASAPDYWVRLNTVQEQDLTAGYGTGGLTGWGSNPAAASTIQANFLHATIMAAQENHFRDDYGYLSTIAKNCEFYSGNLGGYNDYFYFTNCLLSEAQVGANNPGSCFYMQNCTMHYGLIYTTHGGTWPVVIVSSVFEGTAVNMDTNYTYCDYDAFITNGARLSVLGAHDVTNILSFNWQSSWLGNFYLPSDSPLIDAGNTNANLLGLYHFTTQTNQTVEVNTIVDIGYHYVATDAYGNPLDSNGNGIPDYVEDANGNGQSLTITLTSPANNSTFAEPANIPLQASVFDWSSTVTNVIFLRSTIQVNTVTNSPYQFTWPIVASGTYSVTGTAYDKAGAIAVSMPVNIVVTNICGSSN